jgi:hypothetical protein
LSHFIVYVAKTDNILAFYGPKTTSSFATGTNGGNVDNIAGGRVSLTAKHVAGNNHEAGSGSGGGFEELSSGGVKLWHESVFKLGLR